MTLKPPDPDKTKAVFLKPFTFLYHCQSKSVQEQSFSLILDKYVLPSLKAQMQAVSP